MTDHAARAVELTEQALDPAEGVTIRHIAVAAAQVHATLALAEAVGGRDCEVMGCARYISCPHTTEPVPDVTFDNPITVGGVPAEERGCVCPRLGTRILARSPKCPVHRAPESLPVVEPGHFDTEQQ